MEEITGATRPFSVGPSESPDQSDEPEGETIETEAISKQSENNQPSDCLEGPQASTDADSDRYKKLGNVGRKRKYDELGNNQELPVKELVMYRHQMGSFGSGLSAYMEEYYEKWYFTPPNKRKDKAEYERHVKCWERRERWIAEAEREEAQALADSGIAYLPQKRAAH